MDTKKTQSQARFSLTAVLIEDQHVGGFTAYIAEFPEAISEGDTKEEAFSNLLEGISVDSGIQKRSRRDRRLHEPAFSGNHSNAGS
ncbi:hypothetical protein COLO4_02375 [Corchorus olitorius]|uniref:Type II toxin-antitoxin system HicB family antitoxin n=1 Tax=Corchorus olitorius TaxID=93759 RepID=A0A1R3L135_9ROSI|nr:hypothetical protein COLO4_02375 [Corchorus olitorius]